VTFFFQKKKQLKKIKNKKKPHTDM